MKKDEAISTEKLRIENKNTGAALGATKLELEEKKVLRIKAQDEYDLMTKNASMREQKMLLVILTNQIKFYDDGAKANKKVQSEIAKDNDKTFEERTVAIAKMKAIDTENYKLQIAAISKFAGEKVDVQKIVAEADTSEAFKMIENSGLALGAQKELIAIINSRKEAILITSQAEIAIAKRAADESIKALNDELNVYISNQDLKVAKGQVSDEEQLQFEKERADKSYKNEIDTLTLKLSTKQITQAEFDSLEIAAQSAKDITIAENEKALADLKIAQQATDLQNKLATAEMEGADLYTLQQAQLDAQQQAELASADKTGADVLEINKKYKELQKKLDDTALQTRLKTASEFVGNIGKIAGQGTKVAKMAASAEVAINTFAEISGIFKSTAGWGPIGWAIGAAKAGASLAMGVSSVKSILATKSGLPGDSGGGGGSLPSANISAPAIPTSITGGIVSRTTEASNTEATTTNAVNNAMKQNPVQPVLVTNDLTVAMNQKVQIKTDNSL